MYGELRVFVSSGVEMVERHVYTHTKATDWQRLSSDCTQFSLFYSTTEYAPSNPSTCGREHIQFLKHCVCFSRLDDWSNPMYRRLRWSSGLRAGLWFPSSRVQTRPKPLDFFCVKNPRPAFLQRGS
jgi:hypothetical protein